MYAFALALFFYMLTRRRYLFVHIAGELAADLPWTCPQVLLSVRSRYMSCGHKHCWS